MRREHRLNLQSEFLIPFRVERGAFDRSGPDEFGRKSGVQAVSLFSSVQNAAVARTVAVVADATAYHADGVAGSRAETRSVGRANLIAVASGRYDNS